MLATNYPSHVALRDWWRLCRPLTKSRAGTSLAARGPGWAGWPGGWWPPPGGGLIRMRKPGAGPGWGSTGRSRRGSGGTRTRPPRHSQTWSWCSAPSPGSRDHVITQPITRHVSHVSVSRMAQSHFNTIQCVPLLYPYVLILNYERIYHWLAIKLLMMSGEERCRCHALASLSGDIRN